MKMTDVLLITNDTKTAGQVRSALKQSPLGTEARSCRDMTELRTWLSNAGPAEGQTVIVDIDPDPANILYNMSRVSTAHPGAQFIVVSSDSSEKLILDAMQAGARDFLRKDAIATQVDRILERILRSDVDEDTTLGDVLTVFSCSGGCGATTVSVNLARELRIKSDKPVLIVDLDEAYGATASYLGVSGQHGVADVLDHDAIDRELIQSSAVNYAGTLDVLLSPASARSNAAFNLDRLPDAIEMCKRTHRYVVVDAPRMAPSAAADLAAVSRYVLVVFQLTVRDLHFARALIAQLAERGVAPEKILPVANRAKKRGPLVRLEDSKRAIGASSFHRIRSDWRKAMKSVNHAKPLADIARRSGLRSDFRRLAAKIYELTPNGNQKIGGNGRA